MKLRVLTAIALAAGLLEKVYENALAYEVRAAGLSAMQQRYLGR